jgi:Protein of unknown function
VRCFWYHFAKLRATLCCGYLCRFEELAVQAGIDLDAEDFRLEDLKMYSFEADIRKARHGGNANGNSSSNNNNSSSNNIDDDGSLMDDGDAALQGALNSSNQKLTQKERSIYQMVDMLSKRLLSLNTIVADRSTGCKFDLDESTPLRSSQTRKSSLCAATASLGMILQATSTDDSTGDTNMTEEQQQQQHASGTRTGATIGSVSGATAKLTSANNNTDGYTGNSSSSTAYKPIEEAYITDAARLTFRHAPSTESGKKLEALFNFEVPREGGGVTGSNGYNSNSYHHNGAYHNGKHVGASGKQKRREARRMEARKHERMVYERKLQGNLERYVTRSVSDIIYRMPGCHSDNDNTERDPLITQFAAIDTGNTDITAAATTEGNSNSNNTSAKSISKAPTAAAALVRTSSQATLQTAAAAIPAVSHAVHDVVFWSADDDVKLKKSSHTVGANETFPIAVGGADMNPKLLLSYACERIVLPGGARKFRHLVLMPASQQLFVHMYWFIHCKFFQENSTAEQAHLLHSISILYIQVRRTYMQTCTLLCCSTNSTHFCQLYVAPVHAFNIVLVLSTTTL